MKTCSQAVANYLLDLAYKDGEELTQLKLIKMVYLVHGFSLAELNKSALNHHYDRVEAWKFGPVIPSLYHEFKNFGGDNITRKSVFLNDNYEAIEAELKDQEIKQAASFVWRNFKHMTPHQLVAYTHEEGTPWSEVYKPHANNVITDEATKAYFKLLVKVIKRRITDA